MRKAKPILDVSDPQKAVRLVGHPYRAAIIAFLERRDTASPKEVAKHLGVKLENLSYHFKVLRDAGALELVAEERATGATVRHVYRLAGKPRIGPEAWEALSQFHREVLMGNSLTQLWRETTAAAATGAIAKPESLLGRFGLRVDDQAYREIHDILERAIGDIRAAEARAAARIEAHESEEQSATVVTMLFDTPDPAAVMALDDQPKARPRRVRPSGV